MSYRPRLTFAAVLALTASWATMMPTRALADEVATAAAAQARPVATTDPSPLVHGAQEQPVAPVTATTRPTLDPAAMKTAFADLDDPDPATRRQAYERLMGMSRADLDPFRNIVEQSRPLAPSQVAVLREIVAQAFLSGESYQPVPKAGFLGVKLQVVAVTNRPENGQAAANEPAEVNDGGLPARVGILIAERVPGFCGARSLVEGDVILSIVGHPLRLTSDRLDDLLTAEFSMAIRECGPGATVTFELLRQGRVMRVPVRLDARPEALEQNAAGGAARVLLDDFRNDRIRKADRYWNETFRPLLGEQVG